MSSTPQQHPHHAFTPQQQQCCPSQQQTEILTVSPKTAIQCSTDECQKFLDAKQQFQIFVNPHSTGIVAPQIFANSYSTGAASDGMDCLMKDLSLDNDVDAVLVNNNDSFDDEIPQNPVQNHQNQPEAINSSPNLVQKPLEIQFTQGTTDLPQDLILSIPDQHELNDNMEHIQHLLYVEPSLSLQDVVICIAFLLQNGRYQADLKLVGNVLQRYDTTLNDYEPFVYIDKELQYTRSLVATDNLNWTLLLLCWNPHTQSPIHNHPNCECFVRVLKNSLTEYRYHHPDDTNNSNVNEIGCDVNCNVNNTSKNSTTDGNDNATNENKLKCFASQEARAGMVTFMNDDIGLHKLANQGDEVAMTLHLYFPPYNSCKIYLNSSRIATISNICYHSIRGKPNTFEGALGNPNPQSLPDICSKALE